MTGAACSLGEAAINLSLPIELGLLAIDSFNLVQTHYIVQLHLALSDSDPLSQAHSLKPHDSFSQSLPDTCDLSLKKTLHITFHTEYTHVFQRSRNCMTERGEKNLSGKKEGSNFGVCVF